MTEALAVRVTRSNRRRKTVQARRVDGALEVMIPAGMSAADEAHWVEEMRRRFATEEAGDRPTDADLLRRATALARRYRLPRPAAVRWSTRQDRRWGSCTPASGTVRLSARLVGVPSWVLDYVIVHELAHLEVVAHDGVFHDLVARYPRAERAAGFLEAWGLRG